MSKSRPKRPEPRLPATASPQAVVDHGFIPVRAKLLEVAAFLDRVERYGIARDFRCVALRHAAAVLVDGRPERVRRILEKLSDPTDEPAAGMSAGVALGAWAAPAGNGSKFDRPRARRK